MEKCPMLMECQQVETCYIGREQYKNALNRTMDLTANPSLGSAGLHLLTSNTELPHRSELPMTLPTYIFLPCRKHGNISEENSPQPRTSTNATPPAGEGKSSVLLVVSPKMGLNQA
jgi:hypothetical protein